MDDNLTVNNIINKIHNSNKILHKGVRGAIPRTPCVVGESSLPTK